MRNALTIDLEDYFHVTAFADRVSTAGWGNRTSRLEGTTERILSLLDSAGFQATFFTLGWVAETHPHVIHRIADAGHEIACHSLRHRLVYQMTPSEFYEDTRRAKALLEDVSGKQVRGYRAPSFSITRDSWWAFETLARLGFNYDSSIFPVKHPNYGMPDGPRLPFVVRTAAGDIVEFPLPTVEVAGVRAPFGGGAYLRFLPYGYTRWAIEHFNHREQSPLCVYLHPWELDPEQPRVNGSFTARLRHYTGLRGTESKLRRLLRDFQLCPLGCLVDHWAETSSTSSSVIAQERQASMP